jgi:hypothetical protein
LPRRVHIVEGEVRELRELISAGHNLQSKRVALINAIRGYILQEGYRLPDKFFQRRDWREQLAKLPVGETVKGIIHSFMSCVEAMVRSEDDLTERIISIERQADSSA